MNSNNKSKKATPKSQRKTKQLVVTISGDQHDELTALAKESNITVSQATRIVLNKGLSCSLNSPKMAASLAELCNFLENAKASSSIAEDTYNQLAAQIFTLSQFF